jgi:hypothetical protein
MSIFIILRMNVDGKECKKKLYFRMEGILPIRSMTFMLMNFYVIYWHTSLLFRSYI